MHGAGVVNAIEEKDVLGKIQQYCLINIPICKMDIMIPMEKLKKLGVRSIADQQMMKEVLYEFHHSEAHDIPSWKERFNSNLAKIKTGEMRDSAEVVHDLLVRNKEKTLNSSEKQMLHQVQRYLVSEMILIEDITENQAADMLNLS